MSNTIYMTLNNKTLTSPIMKGGTITANLSVNSGVTIDGVDISAYNSATTSTHGARDNYFAYAASEGHVVLQFTAGWTLRSLLLMIFKGSFNAYK